jgi:hypothetical protein
MTKKPEPPLLDFKRDAAGVWTDPLARPVTREWYWSQLGALVTRPELVVAIITS